MKKYAYLVLCLVLTAGMLVGCGCTNRNKGTMPEPTVLPTNEEVWESTQPTTRTTTAPTTAPADMTTEPSVPGTTADHGNGPLDETTSVPTETEAGTSSRTSRAMPRMK